MSSSPSPPSSSTKTYLTLYNTLNLSLWSLVLLRALSSLFTTLSFTNVYPTVGPFTRWTQTLIVLDFAHVALGLVRTSLLTTLLQSYSRLFLVHFIAPYSPRAHLSPFYTTMLISWSIAEITRYGYHIAASNAAQGKAPGWLTWARYNFFFVLYITGAGSEWACMWLSLGEVKKGLGRAVWGMVMVMLVAWPIFFPNQYLHMMSLRRKMMRGKKKA